jgi:hypothetical protein
MERLALRTLHGFAGQLLHKVVDIVHASIKPQLEALRKQGYTSEYTYKLERALKRFCSRFDAQHVIAVAQQTGRSPAEIAQETSQVPEMRELFEKLSDIVLVLAEMEKLHLPRWIQWLVEDLEREGAA